MENYDDNFKKRILKEISEVKNRALVARKNNIPKSTLQTWVSNTKRDTPEERDRTIKSNKIKELEKKLSARELEIEVLRDLLKKNSPTLGERLETVEMFVDSGTTTSSILAYASVANSTWYEQNKHVEKDCRKENKGRKIPGSTINRNGEIIPDERIREILHRYRQQKEFRNGGGYRKLTYYIQRDYGYYINHKKIYRLCKEEKLLLPRKRKNRRDKNHSIPFMNRVITAPFQLWELDMKYGYIPGEQRFFYM